MNHFDLMNENEYKGQMLRQEAEARRLVKEARRGQRVSQPSAVGIAHMVQMILVVLGR